MPFLLLQCREEADLIRQVEVWEKSSSAGVGVAYQANATKSNKTPKRVVVGSNQSQSEPKNKQLQVELYKVGATLLFDSGVVVIDGVLICNRRS